MRLLCVLFILLAAGLGVSVGSVQAVESWALYDDFNGATIDPARWVGREKPLLAHAGDAHRILQSGTLRMRYAGYGETTSNTGGVLNWLGLEFIRPGPITAVKATITAANYGMQGCPSNPGFGGTQVRARFIGTFFNAGTPTPNGDLDNVYAQLRLRRYDADAADTFRVEVYVERCLDSACTTSTYYFNQLANVSKGTPVTMAVIWDKPNKKFIFQSGSQSVEWAYAFPDSSPPSFEVKHLQVYANVPNCTPAPRPYGWITARFDDVYVNASALSARGLRAPAVRGDRPPSAAEQK